MLHAVDTRVATAATALSSLESPQLDLQINVLARDIRAELGASATIVGTIKDGILTVLGVDPLLGVSDTAISTLSDMSRTEVGPFALRPCWWLQSNVDGRLADILIAPLRPSSADGTTFIASVFDPQIEQCQRDVEVKFIQRRALLASYLQIWHYARCHERRENALELALSSMRTGVVLLDEQSNVVFSNAVANRMFTEANCLKLRRGRLVATNLRDNVRLNVALQHVSTLFDAQGHEQRAPMLALERGDGTSLVLLALPLQEPASGRDAITILHIVDPKVDFADHVRPLCRMYRLSRTETDLACLLARGLTLAHAAEAMRMKEQTARSTLRSIFYKTGTGRQTELVLLLLSRVVPTSSTLQIEAF